MPGCAPLRATQSRRPNLAGASVQPVLLSVQERPGGRLALVYSVAPGQRITIVAPDTGDTEKLAADIAAAVIPIIGRARQEAGRQ